MGMPSHSTLRASSWQGTPEAGAVPRGGVWHCSQRHTLPGAWMDATSCTLGQAQLLWLVQQYSCAHTGLCQEGAGLAGGWTCGSERAGRAVPVSGGVQANPQPEKQHLCSPGQSRSSVQWLGQATALCWARFRGQNPGLAGGKAQGLACSQPGPTAHNAPTVKWGLQTPGAAPGHPQPGMGILQDTSPGSASTQRVQQPRVQHLSPERHAVSL